MKSIYPSIAGNARRQPVWVGNRECLDYKYIRQELDKLCNEWNIVKIPDKSKQAWKEILIKKWHIKFEKIHPFVDGNGRTGRIIMNKQRMRLGLPIEIIHVGQEQMEYYKWFREEE
jgi:fido (protein-threonine AMPylation protein)